MTEHKSTTKNNIRAKRRRRLLRGILGIFKLMLLVAVLSGVCWASWQELRRGAAVYQKYETYYNAYKERKEARRSPTDEKCEAYMNVLVLGTDKAGDFDGRHADTILLLSLDNASGKVRVISIPRGMVLVAPDGAKWERIGEKFSAVGISGMTEAVRNLLGVPVDYYVVVDAQAAGSLIDALGGIDVYVEMRMDYDDPELGLSIHIPQGFQHMNGDVAQKYLRFRSGELGDVGRVQAGYGWFPGGTASVDGGGPDHRLAVRRADAGDAGAPAGAGQGPAGAGEHQRGGLGQRAAGGGPEGAFAGSAGDVHAARPSVRRG